MKKENTSTIILILMCVIVTIIGTSIATSRTFNAFDCGIIMSKKYIPERIETGFKRENGYKKPCYIVHPAEYIITIKDEKRLSYPECEIRCTAHEFNQCKVGEWFERG